MFLSSVKARMLALLVNVIREIAKELVRTLKQMSVRFRLASAGVGV